MEYAHILMVEFTTVTGKTTYTMVLDKLLISLIITIRECGKMDINKDKDSKDIHLGISMMVNGIEI